MSNSEQLISLIKTIHEENFSKTYFDMYLTSSRMIFLHKKSKFDNSGALVGYAVGGVLGGVSGAIIGATLHDRAESKKGKDKAKSFDELLNADKKSHFVNYGDVEW
jgi:hypothetical protein